LDGSSITVREIDAVHITKKSVTDSDAASATALPQNADIGLLMGFHTIQSPYTFSINKQTLIDDLHAELSALSSRVERARKGEFKLYTGFSWPIVYGDRPNDRNYGIFQPAGEMPAARRTPSEYYLGKMAKVASVTYQLIDEGQRNARTEREAHARDV
jgi:hypothetical protein